MFTRGTRDAVHIQQNRARGGEALQAAGRVPQADLRQEDLRRDLRLSAAVPMHRPRRQRRRTRQELERGPDGGGTVRPKGSFQQSRFRRDSYLQLSFRLCFVRTRMTTHRYFISFHLIFLFVTE